MLKLALGAHACTIRRVNGMPILSPWADDGFRLAVEEHLGRGGAPCLDEPRRPGGGPGRRGAVGTQAGSSWGRRFSPWP